jgi:mannose/fructose/N-acetylgalactosamine-specific phosphotransferase system component IID
MARLTGGDLRRVAKRTTLLQATWNYERQQGLGWAFCLAPALERLYPDADERSRRLAEHTAYFNTQPTLASFALGAVAQLEERRACRRAEGAAVEADDDGLARIKAVLGSALAALGDQLFWFTLRPFAICLGVLFALGGSWLGAVVLWLSYNLVHLTLRMRGVGWGYAAGPAVLGAGLRDRLERMTRLLSQLGAALVGIVVAALLVPGGDPQPVAFQAILAAGLSVGLVTAQRPRPSPTQWAIGAGALSMAAVWFR